MNRGFEGLTFVPADSDNTADVGQFWLGVQRTGAIYRVRPIGFSRLMFRSVYDIDRMVLQIELHPTDIAFEVKDTITVSAPHACSNINYLFCSSQQL